MNILQVVGYLLFGLILLCTLYVIQASLRPALPGPNLIEYLPTGLVFPMLRDPLLFSTVLDKLGHVYGDIFSMWMGPTRVVVTSVPEDVVQVVSTAKDFDRPPAIKAVFSTLAPGGIFCMPLNEHFKLRRKIRDGFNHTMLRSLHNHMSNAVKELCESLGAISETEIVDISELLTISTFHIITNVAFGASLSRKDRFEFQQDVKQTAQEMTEEILGYPFRQALTPFGVRDKFFEVRDRIRHTCASFIEKRREESPEERRTRNPDLLDAILAVDGHPDSVLTSVATEFTLGGTYSPSQTIAWCVYEICCNLRVQRRIEQELSNLLDGHAMDQPLSFEDLEHVPYLTNIWKEASRLHPVGPFITRRTTRKVTLKGSGIQLPKGIEVLANYRPCHLSSAAWDEPESFKPERWAQVKNGTGIPAGAYIPFGLGQHHCPGQFVADYEGVLILAELYRRFRFSLACPPEQVVNCTTFVDVPMYRNSKTGIEMGVPVYVHLRSVSNTRISD